MVMVVALVIGTAQAAVPFQAMSVETKITSADVPDCQSVIREQHYLFKAAFTPGGQSDGILPAV